jgi:hypothetical protein
MSVEVEFQLADDFAFIAACEPGAQHVSAAMLVFGSTEKTLNIALAANEGVQEEVKISFDEITHHIRCCARKGRSAHMKCSILTDGDKEFLERPFLTVETRHLMSSRDSTKILRYASSFKRRGRK